MLVRVRFKIQEKVRPVIRLSLNSVNQIIFFNPFNYFNEHSTYLFLEFQLLMVF